MINHHHTENYLLKQICNNTPQKHKSFGNRNLQKDAGNSPPFLNEVFVQCQCNYELRGNNFLERRGVKSVRYGTESISSLTPKIWEILPNEIKDSDTLQTFKAKIKKWVPIECPCRLCKIYLPQVGFIREVFIYFSFFLHLLEQKNKTLVFNK